VSSCANCNAVYRERAHVVALAARLALALGYTAGRRAHEPDPDPSWDDDWETVVVIDLPLGQVSWHFHDSEWPLIATLPLYPGSWDGHTTDTKYERLRETLGWLDLEIIARRRR
jgi:hypothetical protein